MWFKINKPKRTLLGRSVRFDDTNKLLKDIKSLLRRQSRIEMIKKVLESDK